MLGWSSFLPVLVFNPLFKKRGISIYFVRVNPSVRLLWCLLISLWLPLISQRGNEIMWWFLTTRCRSRKIIWFIDQSPKLYTIIPPLENRGGSTFLALPSETNIFLLFSSGILDFYCAASASVVSYRAYRFHTCTTPTFWLSTSIFFFIWTLSFNIGNGLILCVDGSKSQWA